MRYFSYAYDREQNIGELVLESLLSSNIVSITDLDLGYNKSWFKHPETYEERSGNIDLLVELISKLTGLQKINLNGNKLPSIAKQTIKTRITAHCEISIDY